jgi:hypothetical protein
MTTVKFDRAIPGAGQLWISFGRFGGSVGFPVNINDVVALELHLVPPVEAGNADRLVPECADEVASLHSDDLHPHAFGPRPSAPPVVHQVEYSRNLLVRSGAQMDRVVNTMVDRTRSRLDVPTLRTLVGAKRRPRLGGTPDLSPRLAVVTETPRWDLTRFKVHFGRVTLKGSTNGEHVLRFEAVAHNTNQLGCGRAIGKFPQIVTRLAGMAERFSHHPGLRRHRLPARRHA